jgi:hypothetical protein
MVDFAKMSSVILQIYMENSLPNNATSISFTRDNHSSKLAWNSSPYMILYKGQLSLFSASDSPLSSHEKEVSADIKSVTMATQQFNLLK